MHKKLENSEESFEEWEARYRALHKHDAALTDVNTRRRNMLKWIFFTGGAFILGKILGPKFSLFGDSVPFGKTHLFKNFRVVESGDELGFYDGFGNEILVFEKDPHAGE